MYTLFALTNDGYVFIDHVPAAVAFDAAVHLNAFDPSAPAGPLAPVKPAEPVAPVAPEPVAPVKPAPP